MSVTAAKLGARDGLASAVDFSSTAGAGARAASTREISWATLASGLLGMGAIARPGFADGGYFQSTWAWTALALASVAAIRLLVRRHVSVGRLGWSALAALSGLALWMLASSVWGMAGSETVREAERASLYVAGLAAFLLLVDRSSARGLLVGALCGILALESHALADRLVAPRPPDPFEGTLLVGAVGYANALGILAAVGLLLAAGLGLSEPRHGLRALFAAASLVSASTLALTSSRGAIVALAVGALVFVALRRGAHGPRRARSSWAAAAAVAVASVAVGLATSSLSLGHRTAYWRVAVDDARSHPALGSGAGSFDDYWLAHRPLPVNVRDAHSLYLETLAELGPVGLALLLAALGAPVLAAARAREHEVVPIAAGAYSAFLVHAGLDWDWEMPVTTLAGLACGAALLASVVQDSNGGGKTCTHNS